jgi:hypothetical protein
MSAEKVAPFAEKIGTPAAFATTPEDPEINQPTIDYVAAFVPNETGTKFNPHLTVGLAMQPTWTRRSRFARWGVRRPKKNATTTPSLTERFPKLNVVGSRPIPLTRKSVRCMGLRGSPVLRLILQIVLDEPTQHLDFVGLAALEAILAAWPGGLLVVSHDAELLDAIGVSRRLDL